jgi:hypothetical protein
MFKALLQTRLSSFFLVNLTNSRLKEGFLVPGLVYGKVSEIGLDLLADRSYRSYRIINNLLVTNNEAIVNYLFRRGRFCTLCRWS